MGRSRSPDGTAPAAAGLELDRIAVRYFADHTRDASLDYLAPALTEGLIDALALVPALDVVSSNGVARYRDPAVGPDSVARALAAGTVVQGSVEEVGDELRTELHLVDGESGATLERRVIELPVSEPLP